MILCFRLINRILFAHIVVHEIGHGVVGLLSKSVPLCNKIMLFNSWFLFFICALYGCCLFLSFFQYSANIRIYKQYKEDFLRKETLYRKSVFKIRIQISRRKRKLYRVYCFTFFSTKYFPLKWAWGIYYVLNIFLYQTFIYIYIHTLFVLYKNTIFICLLIIKDVLSKSDSFPLWICKLSTASKQSYTKIYKRLSIYIYFVYDTRRKNIDNLLQQSFTRKSKLIHFTLYDEQNSLAVFNRTTHSVAIWNTLYFTLYVIKIIT